MKISTRMIVVILVIALVLSAVLCAWYFGPDRSTLQDAAIDVYIKIVCEK